MLPDGYDSNVKTVIVEIIIEMLNWIFLQKKDSWNIIKSYRNKASKILQLVQCHSLDSYDRKLKQKIKLCVNSYMKALYDTCKFNM